jgi:starvation-inducible outer membrane lipoprotein
LKTLIIILALALTGCSAWEKKLTRPLVIPPDFYICEETQDLLICDSAELDNCWGNLEDEPITTIEEKEL